MLKKILLGLGALLVILVLVIVSRPSHFRIERSVTMAASPETAFALVNDFRQWSHWSPYEKMDPTVRKTFSGPDSGVGAKYHWVGDTIGEGEMTLTGVQPHERIVINLEFIKPFASSNTATFEFVPAGGSTTVTWRMEGDYNIVSKAFGVFMDMEAMFGQHFTDGLTAMKATAESNQAALAPAGIAGH